MSRKSLIRLLLRPALAYGCDSLILPLEQVIGVRIPGGQPINSASYARLFRPSIFVHIPSTKAGLFSSSTAAFAACVEMCMQSWVTCAEMCLPFALRVDAELSPAPI